jgi:short-subunit dehydrogenase
VFQNRFTLADKVVWLTGASSGIGEALAPLLADRGAALVLSARRADVLDRVRAGCARPDHHQVLPLDLLAPDSFEPAVRSVLDRFGRIDLLVHCAGISQRAAAIETRMEVDRHIMAVNYFAPVALTKLVVPSMLSRRSGHVVVVSSLLGKFGVPARSAYCASKHALHGFFDALRAELHDQGITVTLVCPGPVHTNASMNALKADGTPQGTLDPYLTRGLTSEECARRMLHAIERRRREVYIAGKERFAVYLSRWAPGLFSRYVRRVSLR